MRTFLSVIVGSLIAVLVAFSVMAFYGYFYPMKYKNEILQYSKEFNIKPELVASVINVESRFKSDTTSQKGAIGLMQILPSTAEWIADRLGDRFDKNGVYNIDINIRYGCYYLSYLKDYFTSEKTAICAYNAGMGNVNNWLSNEEYSSDGEELKVIPFKETRNYVEKVTKNIKYYKNKY